MLRKGQENQPVGEEQGDEGGDNTSALRSAMPTAASQGLPPTTAPSPSGWAQPRPWVQAQPSVGEKQPLWAPCFLTREPVQVGREEEMGTVGQGTGAGHGTSPVIPGRFELIAGRGVSSHLTVLPWGFPFYENCCFWCDLL